MTDIKFLNNFRDYLFICLFISIVVSIIFTSSISGFHFVAVLLISFSFTISKIFYLINLNSGILSYKIRLFCFSLITNFLFVFIIGWILIYINDIPFLSLNDDYFYNNLAKQLANYWNVNGFDIEDLYGGGYSGFPNFSAILMYITGFHEWWIPRIGNSILASFVVLFVFNIINSLYNNLRLSKLISSILAFSPYILIYASVQLKDMLLLFLTLGVFNYYIKIILEQLNIKNILIIIFFLFLMLFVRPGVIFALVAAIALHQLFFMPKKNKLYNYFFIILFMFLSYNAWNYIAQTTSAIDLEFYWEQRVGSRLGGEAVVGSDASINASSLKEIASIPFYVLISPFFPQPEIVNLNILEKYYTNFNFSPSIYKVSLIPFFFLSVFALFKKKREFKLVWVFLIFYVLYRFGQSISMSLFSLRQSLPAEICAIIILPTMFYIKDRILFRKIIFILSYLFMVGFSLGRLSLRM